MRRITITLDLDTLPGAIAESIATVLTQHRLQVRDAASVRLDKPTLACVLRELGRNAAQTVVLQDVLTQAAEVECTAAEQVRP